MAETGTKKRLIDIDKTGCFSGAKEVDAHRDLSKVSTCERVTEENNKEDWKEDPVESEKEDPVSSEEEDPVSREKEDPVES